MEEGKKTWRETQETSRLKPQLSQASETAVQRLEKSRQWGGRG